MPAIDFLGETFSPRSTNVDCQRTINFYPEVNKKESKSFITLIGTPGLALFSTAGAIIRGMHVFNGMMYVVAGNHLYSVGNTGNISLLAAIGTSSGRVSMKDNGMAYAGIGGNQLCIVDGVNTYILNVVTQGWSEINGSYLSQLAYIDGYFVGIGANVMNAFASNLYDGTTWQSLATSPISAAPDSLQGVINLHQLVWFVKQYTSEIWYDAGVATSVGFPFQRVPGAVIDYGTMAPWSIVRAHDTFFFVAQQMLNDSGEFIGIVAINAFTADVISHQAMNYQISQMGDLSNVSAYSYAEGGHTFVVFNFPNITYVFDTLTKMWHERSYYSGQGQYILNRHLGECYCYFNNKHYISDYRANGNIYEMSSNYLDDAGVPIISMRVAQHLPDKNTLDNVFFSKIQIDMETGV